MTYLLLVQITHPATGEEMHKQFAYQGETKQEILDQIDTLPFHRHNLKLFGRTAFKDAHGAKHKWRLKQVKENDTRH